MNPRFRTGILILIVGVVLVGFGIFALSQFISQSLAPLPAPTPLPPITEKVLVAARDLPVGHLFTEADLLLLEIPVEMVPRNAIQDMGEVTGRQSKVAMVSGELVLAHHLVDPTNISRDKAFTIEENQVLVAFPATDLMSSLYILQIGDQVELLATLPQEITIITTNELGEREERVEKRLYTFDAMPRITLQAVIADIAVDERAAPVTLTTEGGAQVAMPTPTPSPEQVNVRAYLLAMTVQDALVMKNLRDAGAIFDIALRNPQSETLVNTSPVSIEYLVDRFNLPVELIRDR